ncbi:MAG: hypothetical protein GTN36_04265 [Candidatus Aenigmarchaeota archaeon]|nr:hypothetical protein [Candidatus Aenigmarchaeota archaeon]
MVSTKRIYRMAKQKLPAVMKEACEIFSVDNFDSEIIWDETPRETPFHYGYDSRKIEFSPQGFLRVYPLMKKTLSQNLRDFTPEMFIMSYLGHEASHKVQDKKSKYEISMEMMELIVADDLHNDKEARVIRHVCSGIMEGFAAYAEDIIFERFGLHDLKTENNKIFELTFTMATIKNLNVASEDIPKIFSEEPERAKEFICFVEKLQKRVYEKRGLKTFREHAEIWRPSQISYEIAKTLLENSLNFSTARYLGV